MKLALLTIAASLVATAAAAQSCPYGYFATSGGCRSIQNPTQGNPNYAPHPNAVGTQQGGGINPNGPYQQVNPNAQQYVARQLPDGRIIYVPVRPGGY